MSPFLAELLGTMLLILMGGGVVANVCLSKTKGNGAGWIAITTAWALGVFIGVVVAGPYSGAHLNPAVSIGLAIGGTFPWCDVCTYIAGQMIGAALGALLVWLVYKDHFNATDDPDAELGVFCTSPAIKDYPINFLGEMIGTFALMFVVFFITDGELTYESNSTLPIGLGSVGAIPVAFTVWVIGLSLGGTTGYAINPARDLAPRFIHFILPIKGKGSSHWEYAWVPVLGPIARGRYCRYALLCIEIISCIIRITFGTAAFTSGVRSIPTSLILRVEMTMRWVSGRSSVRIMASIISFRPISWALMSGGKSVA